jgi:hypothetical protein
VNEASDTHALDGARHGRSDHGLHLHGTEDGQGLALGHLGTLSHLTHEQARTHIQETQVREIQQLQQQTNMGATKRRPKSHTDGSP